MYVDNDRSANMPARTPLIKAVMIGIIFPTLVEPLSKLREFRGQRTNQD